MAKIVTLDSGKIKGFTFDLEAEMLKKAGHTLVETTCQNEEEVIAACRDADVVLTVISPVTAAVIGSMEKCKAVLCYGIGYDHVDLAAAGKKGVVVCNVPDYCTEEVAVHAVALILGCIRKLVFYDDRIRQGIWNSGEGYTVKRASLTSVGLIGFGAIARNVARYLSTFGFKILVQDPFVDAAALPSYVNLVSLDELYAESDVISLHAPNTEDTFHMINAESIAKMKDGVILVNTSRGGLVKEQDAIAALQSGKIKAAGFDVWESEPVRDANHPLCSMENVVLTPHAGHVSVQATMDLHRKVAENALRVLAGETPLNIVNKKFLKQD